MHGGANKELIMPSDPLVKCEMQDLMGMQQRGTGQLMLLAMYCNPVNAEDGVIMKQEFLELGGLMMQTRMKYKQDLDEDLKFWLAPECLTDGKFSEKSDVVRKS